MWQLLPSSFLVFPLKTTVICIIIPIPSDLINGFKAWFTSFRFAHTCFLRFRLQKQVLIISVSEMLRLIRLTILVWVSAVPERLKIE